MEQPRRRKNDKRMKEKAEKFFDMLSSQLENFSSETKLTKESFEVRLQEVFNNLPEGPLRTYLVEHVSRYAKRLYRKYSDFIFVLLKRPQLSRKIEGTYSDEASNQGSGVHHCFISHDLGY